MAADNKVKEVVTALDNQDKKDSSTLAKEAIIAIVGIVGLGFLIFHYGKSIAMKG